LDAAPLDELRGIAPNFGQNVVREVIDLFLDDLPSQVSALNVASAAGDLQALALAAHRLKSASKGVGAARLAALCAEVEEFGHRGALESARDALCKLMQETQAAAAALETEKTRHSPEG